MAKLSVLALLLLASAAVLLGPESVAGAAPKPHPNPAVKSPSPPHPRPLPPSPPSPPPSPPTPPGPPKPPRKPPSPPKPPVVIKVKVGLTFTFNGSIPSQPTTQQQLKAVAQLIETVLNLAPARVKLIKERLLPNPPPRFSMVYTVLGFFSQAKAQAWADGVFLGNENLGSWASTFSDLAFLEGHPLIDVEAKASRYDSNPRG